MTSEAIKALMILALYGVLEITLFYSSIGRFAKRSARVRRAETREFASRAPED
ncbi:hypothetical protein ABIF65_005786 [Bradyrhizobium japonicum]|jgi:hypothetical protein|uniref:hypothetical protein n=1 Tax=Bradyrhizobium TaxID=374 RepID=UPI0003FACFF6|nr:MULTISPECIES: hypothetical protein [Bradyrhizobium]MBR0880929.1 hypothetical protein [Bradyrhizobium liaoningense]MBR1001561.1 hypothetical protein [Bradyrhizobium liaoningense]MBR1067585.1 hypothetical protein [Bradyrhizobium liaoningense]MCP1744119.1 hypothetical protein [Bradyrhizobium japonicum]MCP1782409.1 hypothetical protein [Bradyrhizobium japonicum]